MDCTDGSLTIVYKAYGTFNIGNIFTAQLSDASGSFVNPLNIGSVISTVSGAISTKIPLGPDYQWPYQIRVISSSPGLSSLSNAFFSTVPNSSLPSALIT